MEESTINPPDVSEVPIPFVRYTSLDDEVYFERMNHYNLEIFKLLLQLKAYNMRYRKIKIIPPPPNYRPFIRPI
jgi:hypothetical protein